MLPLAGPRLPDSPKALADALERGLAAHGLNAREVVATGTWPALDLLRIDLTGAQVSRPQLPSPRDDTMNGTVTVGRFEVLAEPGEIEGAPAHVRLHGDGAAFVIAPVSAEESVLLIRRAAHGELTIEIRHEDLERLVHSLASKAASGHGVEIKNVKLACTSRGPRAVSIVAEVVAKMFIATATCTLSGDIDLDEYLNARLAHLQFHGEGMVANLAGGFIRPQLAALEGESFPLMNFALGEINLRDVQLVVGDSLRVSAQFGS
ncbi:MAG: hypothetical protein WCF18_10075 [Chthoniobacteraceae bacterium]